MKRILNPHTDSRQRDILLLFIRIIAGILLMTHGYPKLVKLLAQEPVQFASVLGMSKELSLFMAMFSELICALLIVAGLFTRIAAIPVILTMLVIVFHIHWDDPLSSKELPLLYLGIYTYLFFVGAGKYSFDYYMHKKYVHSTVPAS